MRQMDDIKIPLRPYLARFSIYYLVIMALATTLALLWPSIASYATIPSLMAAAGGVSAIFVNDQKRPFDDAERRFMTRMSFALAWFLSLLFSLALVLLQAGVEGTRAVLTLAWSTLETPPNGIIAAAVLAVLSLAMYYALHLSYGRLAKLLARRRAAR